MVTGGQIDISRDNIVVSGGQIDISRDNIVVSGGEINMSPGKGGLMIKNLQIILW